MTRTIDPIVATTCEILASEGARQPLVPETGGTYDLFLVQDPWGLRRAVVPLFIRDKTGALQGVGTAFHVDGWGTFVTADHVVDIMRNEKSLPPLDNGIRQFSYGPNDAHPVLLLGIGLWYGTVRVPDEAIAPVSSIRSPIRNRTDPIAELQGCIEIEAVADVAVLRLASAIPKNMTGTLPVRLSGWRPRYGETVVAVGYPELSCERISEPGLRHLLSEGMYASYGRIIDVHPGGRGGPTPVIEVEANWPPGMSGGPVFNKQGEVVGIVSRALPPVSDVLGNGGAVCLEMLPWISDWLATVDGLNPGWRIGWAVGDFQTGDLVGCFRSREEANLYAQNLERAADIRYGAHRIGTNDFVSKGHAE